MRKDRELSMYGDEEKGVSPIDLYKEPEATKAKTWAEEIYKQGKNVVYAECNNNILPKKHYSF